MLKLDHLEIAVDESVTSRDFYVNRLGFKIEFEVADPRSETVQDEHDFKLCLEEQPYLLQLWGETSMRKHGSVAK